MGAAGEFDCVERGLVVGARGSVVFLFFSGVVTLRVYVDRVLSYLCSFVFRCFGFREVLINVFIGI